MGGTTILVEHSQTVAAEQQKLAQVDSLLWTLERTRADLVAYRGALAEKVALLIDLWPASEPVDSPDPASPPERRACRRRPGHPVSVDILSADDGEDPASGWVVDRSVGGLGLWADDAEPVGALLRVRASRAAEGALVVVKHCQPMRSTWRLGCAFVGRVPWPLLRQFG
jgi:hypothetical protein